MKAKQRDRRYQANTVRHKTVLSTFYIGWQALMRKDLKIVTMTEAWQLFEVQRSALESLHAIV